MNQQVTNIKVSFVGRNLIKLKYVKICCELLEYSFINYLFYMNARNTIICIYKWVEYFNYPMITNNLWRSKFSYKFISVRHIIFLLCKQLTIWKVIVFPFNAILAGLETLKLYCIFWMWVYKHKCSRSIEK